MTVKLFGLEFADEAERDLALLELQKNLDRITQAENQAMSGWDASQLSPLYGRCGECGRLRVHCRGDA